MQIYDLCIGRPYKAKDNMGNEVEKKRWVKLGVMFQNTDDKTGEDRFSMNLDALPAHGENILAFKKQPYDPNKQQGNNYQPQGQQNAVADASVAPTVKETLTTEEDEIRIEDVPF